MTGRFTCARFLFTLLVAASACASRAADTPTAAAPSDAPAAPAATADGTDATDATFEDQVARGQELYGQHCARCHGADGTGGSAAAVVGAGALQKFSSAAEVFAFASEKMPGDAPGTLSDADMLAILAFDLYANGVDLAEPLGPANANGIPLGAK